MKTEIVGTRVIVKNVKLHKVQIRVTCERCDNSDLVTLEEFADWNGSFNCIMCESDGYADCEMRAYTLIVINDTAVINRDFYVNKLQEVSEKYMKALTTIKRLQKENVAMSKAITYTTKELKEMREHLLIAEVN